jgi:hypothetical protein
MISIDDCDHTELDRRLDVERRGMRDLQRRARPIRMRRPMNAMRRPLRPLRI